MRALEQIEADKSDLEKERAGELAALQDLVQADWWLPAVRLFSNRLVELGDRIADLSERQGKAATLDHRARQIERTLCESRCTTCGHELGTDEHKSLEAKLKEAVAERSRLGEDGAAQRLADLTSQQRTMRQFAASESLGRLVEKDRSWRRQGLRIKAKEREAERVRRRLREHPRELIRSTELKHEQAIRAMKEIEDMISQRSAELAAKQAEYERLQKRLARLPDADPSATLASQVYPTLERTFAQSVESFRNWLRQQVQREASDVFIRLTTEPDYIGLRINDQYGLQIIAAGDRIIRERSAGAEQVVALSLIAGLNRCTRTDAPVVMDTPFGRLDPKHGKNILEFLPTLAAQVVLLVQPREFDRNRDLPYLVDKVAREYQIIRDGGPTRSRLERI